MLGGSIGLAVRQRRLASETAGYVRREASLKDCERAGALDYATTDLLRHRIGSGEKISIGRAGDAALYRVARVIALPAHKA